MRRTTGRAVALVVGMTMAASFLTVSGCGRGATPSEAPTDAAQIDWNKLADDLPTRRLVQLSYWFGDFDRNLPGIRRHRIRYDAQADSLGPEEFAALPVKAQDARRRQARELVKQAVVAVTDRANRLSWVKFGVATSTGWPETLDRTLTRSLARLNTAVGLAPNDIAAWYMLGYFSNVIGDGPTASQAHIRFLAITRDGDPNQRARRCRAILDEAWMLRNNGRHDRCRLWLETHAAELSRGRRPLNGLLPRVEHDLIRGLLAAEDGDTIRAQTWISRLPPVTVRLRSETRESEYLRTWVHAWAALRSGLPDAAARFVSQHGSARLHTGVAWRYWQDLGLISEEVGDLSSAYRCWMTAHRTRPFVGFYPQVALRGPSRVLGVEHADDLFFTSYRTHFVGGSEWGYAVTRALLCQVSDVTDDPLLWREARHALDRCVRRGFHPAEARLLRARLALQCGDLAAAEADLRDAAMLDLTGRRAANDLVFLRGIAALNAVDLDAGRRHLEEAVELAPDNPRGWQALGVCLAYLDEPEAALSAFDQVVDLSPNDGASYYNRGLTHLQFGNREQAEADLTEAAVRMPGNQAIARLLQALASGRDVVIDQGPQPVTLVASDEEIEMASSLATLMDDEADRTAMLDFIGDDHDQRELWLDLLERRHREDPAHAGRLQLAEARNQIGKHNGVQALLADAWPLDLTPRERVLLMTADRATGYADRALDLATTEATARVLSPELAVTAVTLLYDHGHADEARRLLQRAVDLHPREEGLRELAAKLP